MSSRTRPRRPISFGDRLHLSRVGLAWDFGRGDYAEPQYGPPVFGVLPRQRGPLAGLGRLPRQRRRLLYRELPRLWPAGSSRRGQAPARDHAEPDCDRSEAQTSRSPEGSRVAPIVLVAPLHRSRLRIRATRKSGSYDLAYSARPRAITSSISSSFPRPASSDRKPCSISARRVQRSSTRSLSSRPIRS